MTGTRDEGQNELREFFSVPDDEDDEAE